MKIKTRFFGEVEVHKNKIITFNDGVPGVPNLTKFLLMTDEDENSPFCWLQSIEDIDVVFTLFNVLEYLPDYNPIVDRENVVGLGEIKEELIIQCMATIPNTVKDMSINLKAPVVINPTNNLAKQIICNNEEYPIKYYIYKELKKGDK